MYKAILLTDGEKFSDGTINKLNKYFDENWEYVDSITQTLTSPLGHYESIYGRTIIILSSKRKI
jgi:hypothetical protein